MDEGKEANMSTSVRVNMRVDLLENDDGSFTVKVSSNSETFFGDRIVSRTNPTVRKEKKSNSSIEQKPVNILPKKNLNLKVMDKKSELILILDKSGFCKFCIKTFFQS